MHDPRNFLPSSDFPEADCALLGPPVPDDCLRLLTSIEPPTLGFTEPLREADILRPVRAGASSILEVRNGDGGLLGVGLLSNHGLRMVLDRIVLDEKSLPGTFSDKSKVLNELLNQGVQLSLASGTERILVLADSADDVVHGSLKASGLKRQNGEDFLSKTFRTAEDWNMTVGRSEDKSYPLNVYPLSKSDFEGPVEGVTQQFMELMARKEEEGLQLAEFEDLACLNHFSERGGLILTFSLEDRVIAGGCFSPLGACGMIFHIGVDKSIRVPHSDGRGGYRGMGTSLLANGLGFLRDAQIKCVRVGCDNPDAIAFWEARGWRVEEGDLYQWDPPK